ncbi:MAG: DNA mismatch repair protein MutS [Bacteroidetes bacterium]|nr:DNA mismatch repair protein MutS [Bacteroidota bacterium]
MQKQNPTSFFSEELAQSKAASAVFKKRLILFGFARLAAFLAIWLPLVFFSWPVGFLLLWMAACAAVFFLLISKYTDIRLLKNKVDQRSLLCEAELKALQGDSSFFGNGNSHSNPLHPFSYDMDLFGNKSFFQAVNRTGTPESEALLAAILTANNTDNVLKKQQAIRELAQKPGWCLDFRTHQRLQTEPVDQERVVRTMLEHKRLLPLYGPVISLFYGVISVALMGLVAFQVLAWQVLLVPFFIGLLITGIFIKHVTKISQQSSNLAHNFRHIGETLQLIESQQWQAEYLVSSAGEGADQSTKNSNVLLAFSKILSALDQRNNIFFALVANGFFLWDLKHGCRAEQWIIQNSQRIQTVFRQVTNFDVQISLANYAFTHPDFSYPVISEEKTRLITASGIGHPLLSKSKCVTNSFSIRNTDFFIITGANMAGKSTFLRTVGISLVMANCGLPVFADSFTYVPVKLISSMRSSDSLINDESYFFAELKRLKFIVDEIQKQPYFIILDEILKGTNSKDKEQGSRKFLERLSVSGSGGLIATHDLSLCDLAAENNAIHNYYFDAEIKNDELHFDYCLKAGICQNMNASFLLRKMKIVE